MAGGFTPGPIDRPNVVVQQIYQLNAPVPPASTLPAVYVGPNRHVEFDESMGSYVGGTASVYSINSLLAFAGATIESFASISGVDVDTGDNVSSPALPQVVLRHALYGDILLDAADYTVDSLNAELTVNSGVSVDVEALSSSAGSYTAWGTPNFGRRTFTDLTADFLNSGIQVGDSISIGGVAVFTVITVLNQTQLVVEDSVKSYLGPTEAITSASVTYSITRTLTGTSLSGGIFFSYVALRSDRTTQMQTIDFDNIDEELGLGSIYNKLALAANNGLLNTNSAVLCVQVGTDDLAGYTAALDVISNSPLPYNLVPLTQDAAILALFRTHVDTESDSEVGHERRLWQSQVIEDEICRVDENDSTFSTPTKASPTDMQFTVAAAGENIHTFGAKQGDVVKDLTPGFGGEARITSVTPLGGDDGAVDVTLATPNTLGNVGTQGEMTITPVGSQQGGVRLDDVSGALGGEIVTIRGTVFTFGVEWSTTATLVAAINAAFAGALTATNPSGDEVRVETDTGGWTDARLLTDGYTITSNVTGATVESVAGAATPVTQFVVTDMTAGVRDGETFAVRDQAGTLITCEFDNEQLIANGELGDGTSVSLNAVTIAVGGPVLSSAEVRDQIIAAANLKRHSGAFTMSVNGTPPLVTVKADATGQIGSVAATGTITAIQGQEAGTQIDVTGATGGDSVTVAGVLFSYVAVPVLPTDWSTDAELAAAILGNIPNVATATPGANIVEVTTTTYGWTNALLLTAGLTVAKAGALPAWTRIGGAGLSPAAQFNVEGATSGIQDGETFVLSDGVNPARTFEFDRNASVVPGRVTVNIALANTASAAASIIEAAINGASAMNVTAAAVVAAVGLTNDVAGTAGNQTITDTVVDGSFTVAGMSGGTNGTMSGGDTVTAAGFILTSTSPGGGAINGTPLTAWEICSYPLTTDQKATAAAQIPQGIVNRRVSNVWPHKVDVAFTDLSAGIAGPTNGTGLFGGATVIIQRDGGYWNCVGLAGRKSGLNPALPLTGRDVSGVYQLRDVDDTFTRSQLDRILSTGNVLMEQLGGIGTPVTAVRNVTTDTTDLKTIEESVTAAVDNFAKDVRTATRSLFGPNLIDPEGQFYDAFSARVQAVIYRYLDKANRRAADILIESVFENPARKDSVIMEVSFTPVFPANKGIVRIFV